MKLGLDNTGIYRATFLGFAPWYSIIAIIIFALWRLYGGLWRYAGVNDMNRIIGANVCTIVVYVVGTTVFFTRMPIVYYAVGGILQFILIVLIRFGYRVLLVEKKKLRARGLTRIDTVVVGAGENGRRVVKTLEESEAFKPVAIYSKSSTGVMDGIPIVNELRLNNIGAVFIADPLLSAAEREEIKEKTGAAGAELHDYTGYFSNLGGKLSITELLAVVHTPLIISLNGQEKEYKDGQAALADLSEKYEIKKISSEGLLRVELAKQQKLSTKEILAQAYAAVMDGDQR